ncbi:hypothetical protein F2Q68_00005642 [Brassica cretica]|uniref:Uncharacterized protein n=1 Tax=Brassica cretica TaxID=69181 RepID=A0A8S9J849_BRACR|nr:hypothetical protein F2Q68_00005642 [Brassica cretica]
MTSESIEDAEAVLSDVEIDEPSPVALNDPPREDVRDERVTELIAELEKRPRVRIGSPSFVQSAQGSCPRGKDEMKLKLDEVVRDRDALKGEIEKVSGKVRSFKSFTTLPKSQKYTGLASVAYGVIKRANEIVEDLVREIDKSRNEAREQVDQRNYEIAIEVSQLKSTISNLREETRSLRKQLDSQTKELNQRMRQIEEVKEKERIANENIEGLMTDIAAAEEEIARWKVAAEQEAAAGGAVEQDFTSQCWQLNNLESLHVLKEELEEAKQAIKESEKKLKFKEETAAAAMGARDAAERSLKLADSRATRLRERMQELNLG